MAALNGLETDSPVDTALRHFDAWLLLLNVLFACQGGLLLSCRSGSGESVDASLSLVCLVGVGRFHIV